MPHVGVNLPSGSTALALLPLAVLLVGLTAYALIRLFRSGQPRYLPKWAWALIIVVWMPWGALVYLLAGRAAGIAEPQQPTAAPPVAAALPVTAARPEPPPVTAAPTLTALDRAEPAVRTTGVTRDYGGGAGLFDVDLWVPHGTVYGLVGPNGAGKSTLLSIITGLRHADRGQVHIAVDRRRVAVCPDVPEFEPWLTAFETVDLARYYVAPQLGADAVYQALHAGGLADVAHRRVGGFSRGMTQRLGLAAALVGDPELLLLDEPTSALDPAGRAEMLHLVAAMRGRRTVIFSSHILADVQRVADHVGVLRAGRLLYEGPTRDLVDRHLVPRWRIRLSHGADDVTAKLRGEQWVRRVENLGGGELLLDADTLAHGEDGIPEALATCRAGLVSCELVDADLEAAFLALTRTVGPGTPVPDGVRARPLAETETEDRS